MGVIVVEEIHDDVVTDTITSHSQVVEVIRTAEQATELVSGVSVIEVIRPGGSVTNVLYGEGLPSNPYEGMIFLDLS